jgi:CelD/BcsL family acetyltransferase involved in cellulose biosynthesis
VPALSAISASAKCEVDVVSDPARLDELEAEWKALFEASPASSPPLRWEWVREWWRVFGSTYGADGHGLRIITIWRGDSLIGILPLYQNRNRRLGLALRKLRFVSTGAAEFEETCAEYFDLLYLPGQARPCLEALRQLLKQPRRLRWDRLDLSDIGAHSPLLELCRDRSGSIGQTNINPSGACFVSDLEGGFEAYLRRLSQGARGEARKLLREVERSGMQFEMANDIGSVRSFFDQMVVLHRERWARVGKTGSFSPRHAQFHRTLSELLVPRGEAVLARLALNGKPFAVTYGHLLKGTYHCYQRGVTRSSEPVRSPGTALLLRLMAHLAERGVTKYDHLKGINSFKERFATHQSAIVRLRIDRPSLYVLSGQTCEWAANSLHRAVRKLLSFGRRLGTSAGKQS